MVGFREKVNSKFSDNENWYMSCIKGTKYYCITCDLPICNLCSKVRREWRDNRLASTKTYRRSKAHWPKWQVYYILVTACWARDRLQSNLINMCEIRRMTQQSDQSNLINLGRSKLQFSWAHACEVQRWTRTLDSSSRRTFNTCRS